MKTDFYDIESLSNVFLLSNFIRDENAVDIYYLCDDPALTDGPGFAEEVTARVHEKNPNFQDGTVRLFDLHEKDANVRLAEVFGLSDAYLVNDPGSRSSFPRAFRIRCDTDPEFDDSRDPYFFGYNSYNYDTVMLAVYFDKVWQKGTGSLRDAFVPAAAGAMREANNDLFSAAFRTNMTLYLARKKTVSSSGRVSFGPIDYRDSRYAIRRNMLLAGRQVDLARLNEKQRRVRLKRLLGTIGCQILESDRLKSGQDHIDTKDQFLDLAAYNVSDCVNSGKLFDTSLYQSQFFLKKGLLSTYPELVYRKKEGSYEPDIRPEKVRRDRLMIDSSSAQFATQALCPYGHLKDIETVSFDYPSKKRAEELHVPVVNVLEETRKFFYEHFPQEELRRQFDEVLSYYRSIEGKNFNGSKNYQADYPNHRGVSDLAKIPMKRSFLPYFDRDGNPTSCYASFSIGGVHGAEYNKALYEADLAEYRQLLSDQKELQETYGTAAACCKQGTTIVLKDGRTVKRSAFLSGSGARAVWKDLSGKKPQLFEDGLKFDDRYDYTSAGVTNHEDFTSYYPNLLRQMSAFWNEGLGYDRYAEIFAKKQAYGKKMKDASLPQDKRADYRNLREGTKLLLNSASGAGDTSFESNIRMNNRIISMRAIGQMFTWRIGQAQALAGARIISTNTDGLYSVMDKEKNSEILSRESASIGVEIEPEVTYLVSKDANNRLEYSGTGDGVLDGTITQAAGGTLACRQGPNPSKALAHPAIVDWALAEYLVAAAKHVDGLSLEKPFDDAYGRKILERVPEAFPDLTKRLLMFQNMTASGSGDTISCLFGTTDAEPQKPVILLTDNRVFIMKDRAPGTLHLHAAKARAITQAMAKKRAREGDPAQVIEPLAMEVLRANGHESAPAGKDVKTENITNLDPSWYMRIENRDLFCLPDEEKKSILEGLDLNKYLELVRDSFSNSWKNTVPETQDNENRPAGGIDAGYNYEGIHFPGL